jgi:hypothetical protein
MPAASAAVRKEDNTPSIGRHLPVGYQIVVMVQDGDVSLCAKLLLAEEVMVNDFCHNKIFLRSGSPYNW